MSDEVKEVQQTKVEATVPEVVAESVPKSVAESQPHKVTNYFFADCERTGDAVSQTDTELDSAGELVGQALNAGIVHKVQTDGAVKEKILETADKVIDTNLGVIKAKAEKEDKKAFFEANEAACTYFGYDEKTTSKSHVKMMKGWSWFFNTLYIITIGFFVVAPISFFCHKLKVVIKHNWLVFLLALLIYGLIVATPFIATWLGRL